MTARPYRGRFAPSPTGPLHFGSIVAAVASWLDARVRHGSWLVRVEDVDLPRNVPGAAEAILRTLEACGLEWDGEVLFQSRRTSLYGEALELLKSSGHVFACACSRRETAAGVYPGTCRNGPPAGRAPRAWRVLAADREISFADRLQGRFAQNLARDVGDFVVLRADGLYAYQLAVVVDDHHQGVTDVVRGADLLDSTPRQIFLQELLGYATPHYLHLPVAVNRDGEKLSKQTLAPPAGPESLAPALDFLGHPPPPALLSAPPRELLAWARTVWDPARLPKPKFHPRFSAEY